MDYTRVMQPQYVFVLLGTNHYSCG